jgi:hypothetical protein
MARPLFRRATALSIARHLAFVIPAEAETVSRKWPRSPPQPFKVRLGVNWTPCATHFNQGGLMDPALVKQSMTLFAREVMPHFR